MRAAVDFFEVQGFAGDPVVGFEAAVQVLHIVEGAAAFVVAYIEPDAGAIPDFRGALVQVAEDAFVVPPDAGREHGEFAEPGGVAQAEVERDQAAERRTSKPCRLAIGADAVLRGDPGQNLACEGEAVLLGLAAAHAPVGLVGVLVQTAVTGVVNADNDQRLNLAGLDGGVGLFAHLPGAAGNVGSAGIEEILAVLQVEHGVAAFGLLVIAGREVDDQVALVRQVMAGKAAMQAQAGMERGLTGGKQALGQVRPGVVVRLMVFQMQEFLVL